MNNIVNLPPDRRPGGITLISLALLLVPAAGLVLRFPPPLLLLLVLVCAMLAYGLYQYLYIALWGVVFLFSFILIIGTVVLLITLWNSHPEGYPQSLLFMLLLVMTGAALRYLTKEEIRGFYSAPE